MVVIPRLHQPKRGLREFNSAVKHRLHLTYEAEKAKEGMVENATIVKKEVLAILNDKIVVYLRAMEQVAPLTFSEFANTVSVIIAENNEQVKKRGKKTEPESVVEQQD